MYENKVFNINSNTQTDARREVKKLIHILWDKAVEISNYNKKEWMNLQNRLNELMIFV